MLLKDNMQGLLVISPPFLTDFISVPGVCFSPLLLGACGSVARLCQPWERFSCSSCLLVVEAPACPQEPNLHFATRVVKGPISIF